MTSENGSATTLADKDPRTLLTADEVAERLRVTKCWIYAEVRAGRLPHVRLGRYVRSEGGWVDRVVGLEGVRGEIAMVETPEGQGRLELTKFHASSGRGGDRHAPANAPGVRHVTFAVDDIDAAVASVRARGGKLVGEVENYEDIYRLCYVRGPEGIIVELAEQIG